MVSIQNSRFKHINQLTPNDIPLYKQYDWLFIHQEIYWFHFRDVFGPFKQSCVTWDISDEEKLFLTNEDLKKVLIWINKNITVRLSKIDNTTLGVLLRIATGMLNKTDIPKEHQMIFHEHMVTNLQKEYKNIILSGLPF